MNFIGRSAATDNIDISVYSDWTGWSCSTTCGQGTATRTRSCTGGICSRATDLIETSVCNEGGCKYLTQYATYRSLYMYMKRVFHVHLKVFLNGVHGRVVLELSVAKEPKSDTEVAPMVRPEIIVMEQYSLKIMFHVVTSALSMNS